MRRWSLYPAVCIAGLRTRPRFRVRAQVIMFGLRKNGAVRIKQATMEFVVWVLKHASDASMAAMAPLAFRGIMHLLQSMDPHDNGSGSLQLRGFLYQATGQLAEVLLPTISPASQLICLFHVLRAPLVRISSCVWQPNCAMCSVVLAQT